jgi:phage-related protein
MAAVTLTFAGDAKSLEKTFDRVGAGAKDMAGDLDTASGKARSFGGAMDGAGNAADASEGKFMGAADLLDGLGGAFGLPTEGATNMMRSFGDLTGGFAALGPMFGKVMTKLGAMIGLTGGQAAATGTATAAQWSLNSALLANPIGLVVIAIGALVGAFVLAWKHSETFRDIVRGALGVVHGAAMGLWGFFKDLPGNLWGIAGAVMDALAWPYKTAFNLIARLWNSTVGQLAFEIPSWVPGMGGKGFSMPRLPTFATGGVVPGIGPVPILAHGGETVIPRGGTRPGPTVIQVVLDGRVLTEVVHDGLLTKQRRGGTLGFEAA